jgi:hypothetical protein
VRRQQARSAEMVIDDRKVFGLGNDQVDQAKRRER